MSITATPPFTPVLLPKNLNPAARRMMLKVVPKIADEELNHNYFGTEHILAALARQFGEAPMIIFAQRYSVSSEQVFNEVVRVAGKPARGGRVFDPLSVRKRTENYTAVLANAVVVAKERGCKEVGLVDILIAITQAWESRAFKVLQNLGIDPRELAGYAKGMK